MQDPEIYGLLGANIGYSRSPELFHQLWKGDNVPREYRLIDTNDPIPFLTEVRASAEWRGFSVTIPYKEWIVPYLDHLSPIAQAIGAVNAVCVRGEKLYGHNTDVTGFLEPLKPLFSSGFLKSDQKVLILGSGGAAKAVRYALHTKGIKCFTVSRSSNRGDLTYSEITPSLLKEVRMIVNATPLGGTQFPDIIPPIPYSHLNTEHLLYDLIYTPDSGFLTNAPSECPRLNGFPMLQAQAVAAFHFFRKGNTSLLSDV